MGVIGSSGGGYATVNPTQGNPMGEALQNVENSAFKYNAQRISDSKTRQDAEQEVRNARAKEIEASDKYKKDNPFITTGITDIDSQNRASLENAMVARNEAITKYTATNDPKYKAIIAKIDSGVNEMKTFGDAYNTHVKSVTEGTANGTYNMNSAKVKAAGIDETHGKIVRRFDAEGNSVFDVFKTDNEGVVSVVKQGLNSKQLIEYNTPVKAFHIDGLNSPPGFKGKTLVDAFNVNIDKPLTEYIGKGLSRKKKIYSPNAPQVAKTMAETSVKSRDNLYEIFTRMGLDPEDQNNYDNPTIVDDAKKYLEKILLANSPEVLSDDPDVALASLEQRKKQDAETNKRSDRDFNQKKNDGDGEGKVRVSTKDGLLGEETTISETMTKSEYEKKKAEDAKASSAKKKETSTSNNPFADGLNKAFKSGAKAKAPAKKEDEDSRTYMSNGKLSSGTLKPENKIHHLSTTNKGKIGLYDETWFDTKTRKRIPNNQVYGIKEIAIKAKAAGYTTNEYVALLAKKGIYVIQN